MPDKALLRKKVSKRRRNLSERSRQAKSARIFRKIARLACFRSARHVACYYGIAPEVETRSFLEKLIRIKKVYLPQIGPQKKTMVLRRIRSLEEDLQRGAYDIMEPHATCPIRAADRIDLIIVPGVAFDREGGRLGRGAGYYDKLFHRAGKAMKIGVCFREQLVRKVPMRAHDIRMDRVTTD
jgi:5-formyltetrahydrofolate cyclo-ligase